MPEGGGEQTVPHAARTRAEEAAACELAMMGVRRHAQGRGIGTALVRRLLEAAAAAAAADGTCPAVLLSTQEQRNVTYYGRLGFRVVSQARVCIDDRPPFHNWNMLRDPGAPPPP